MHYKKNDDLPMFTSVIVVGCIVAGTTMAIWYNLLKVIYVEMPTHAYGITLLIYLLVHLRYHKRKDKVLNEFRFSKYNDLIPTWTYFILLVVGLAFGIWSSDPISNIIDKYNLNGILWEANPWLKSL